MPVKWVPHTASSTNTVTSTNTVIAADSAGCVADATRSVVQDFVATRLVALFADEVD